MLLKSAPLVCFIVTVDCLTPYLLLATVDCIATTIVVTFDCITNVHLWLLRSTALLLLVANVNCIATIGCYGRLLCHYWLLMSTVSPLLVVIVYWDVTHVCYSLLNSRCQRSQEKTKSRSQFCNTEKQKSRQSSSTDW